MQILPPGWAEARSGFCRWEVKLDIAGVEYNESSILSLNTTSALYAAGSASTGGCVAKEIDVTILPLGEIPRMAEMRVFVRPAPDVQWLPKGVFYIDTREVNRTTGVMTIHGYDSMLKMEQQYVGEEDDGDWPRSMSEVVDEIASRIGVSVDSRTVINQSYAVEYPNDYTMREVMGFIAAAHGGNWTITDERKLRLIPLAGSSDEIDVGNYATSLESTEAFEPFSKVVVTHEDVAYENGGDSGRVLEVECPWATQAMADNILASVIGYAYQPFTAAGAILDPAAELGDIVIVGGLRGVIATIDTKYDAMMASDISAPADEEVDHEYPYTPASEREYKRVNARTSKIEKKVDSITLSVSNGDTTSSIKLLVDGVEIASQDIQFNGYVTVKGLENGETVIDGGCIKADSEIRAPKILGGKFYAGDVNDPDGYVVMTQTGLEVFNGSGLRKIRIGYTSAGHDFPFVELGSGDSSSGSKGLIKKFTDGLWIGNSAAAEASGRFSPASDYNGMFFSFSTGKAYVVQGTDMQNIYTGEAIAKFG